MTSDSHNHPQAAAGEPTYGARFLAAYRASAQGVTWHYDTIQKMKACDREAFIKLLINRGGIAFEAVQQIRSSTPEEFVDWLLKSQQDTQRALILNLILLMNC